MLPGISCDQFSGTETRYGIIAHGWKRNWVHRWVNWWKHLSRHFTLLSSVEYLIKHSQWISQAAKLFINCASALRCFLASFYVDWKSSPPLLTCVADVFPENVFNLHENSYLCSTVCLPFFSLRSVDLIFQHPFLLPNERYLKQFTSTVNIVKFSSREKCLKSFPLQPAKPQRNELENSDISWDSCSRFLLSVA